MAVKAVLCDLDNTLVDFIGMKRTCCEAAVHSMIDHGLGLSHDRALKMLFEVYDKYGIEYEKAFQEFLRRADGSIDFHMLAAGIVAYREAQIPLMAPYPAVIPTLVKLRERGLKLAIVSDAPRLKVWMRLIESGIADFFDAVISFDDTGERKPSALPFNKGLDALGIAPEETLMIGDNPERDIRGAKILGMRTCFARYGYALSKSPPSDSGADADIDSFSELLAVVDRF